MGLSSPVLLSLSAVFIFVGSCIIIASGFTTDWTEYEVDRKAIVSNQDVAKKIGDSFLRNPIYFTRTHGLYHICFPNNVPTDIGSSTYLTSTCIENPDLYPQSAVYEKYNSNQKFRFYALRAILVFFLLGLASLGIAMVIGIISCWSQRTRYVKMTGIVLIVAIFFFIATLCLFHLVEYWEFSVLKTSPFIGSWDPSLRQSTEYKHGLSYYGYWIGLVFLSISDICFFLAVSAIHKERDAAFENKHQAYLQYMGADKSVMPYSYGGPYGMNPYGYPGGYYSQYPTMSGNSYYGYLTYGH
ncbi:hypothetical protein FO519_001116 [Halicephalobus sp. NKZ332]|nr:hypothetical protein FO519_001116 [Halicephalobus sp. NKZ332]